MESASQHAQGTGIAQACGEGATANVVFHGITPEQLMQALRAAGEANKATIDSVSQQLNTTHEAVLGFFKILGTSYVPIEKLKLLI